MLLLKPPKTIFRFLLRRGSFCSRHSRFVTGLSLFSRAPRRDTRQVFRVETFLLGVLNCMLCKTNRGIRENAERRCFMLAVATCNGFLFCYGCDMPRLVLKRRRYKHPAGQRRTRLGRGLATSYYWYSCRLSNALTKSRPDQQRTSVTKLTAFTKHGQ